MSVSPKPGFHFHSIKCCLRRVKSINSFNRIKMKSRFWRDRHTSNIYSIFSLILRYTSRLQVKSFLGEFWLHQSRLSMHQQTQIFLFFCLLYQILSLASLNPAPVQYRPAKLHADSHAKFPSRPHTHPRLKKQLQLSPAPLADPPTSAS